MNRVIKSNRTQDLPNKGELQAWQHNPVTMEIWQRLSSSYNPAQGLRNCAAEKIEYYRGQADILDELAKIFGISDNK